MYILTAEYKVYMLLKSGGGANVRDVWLNGVDIQHAHRHHRNLSLEEIILEGDYKTDQDVDELQHEEVSELEYRPTNLLSACHIKRSVYIGSPMVCDVI
jgi:hypothetical protein